MPSGGKQFTGSVELYGVFTPVASKTPGVPLRIVTYSETIYAGLKGKCAKWERHGWVGSRPLGVVVVQLVVARRQCLTVVGSAPRGRAA